MSVKPDSWIKQMAKEAGMIEPFEAGQVRKGISYGCSSYGYDFRIDRTFRIFNAKGTGVIDPKQMNDTAFEEFEGDFCDIPPASFVLAKTVEYFRIPRDIITICYGKSTYARCGVFVQVTPFEPEWEGHATIAIANLTGRPTRIYAGEGIGQILFLSADGICDVSYADKSGKYQAQRDITLARGQG